MKEKILIVVVGMIFAIICVKTFVLDEYSEGGKRSFYILSNPDNKDFMDELISYGDKEHISVYVEYADDLEALDILEEDSSKYDAVWLSNSIWLYMLNGVKVTNSKSISINPVVMGVKKSKAQELGFVNNEIKNSDILNTVKSKKLKYVMNSVTKTNTGLTAYLGFLNSLAGSPEILTSEMIKDETLISNLKSLFSGVERVSGSTSFLEDMFLKSNDYEAVIATESSLIRINKQLESSGKDTLYLLYPTDGVAINDSPFAYVDRGQEKLDKFNILQSYLLSLDTQKDLEKLGKRTWYGGTNSNADKDVFKTSYGIDTNKYLIPLKYPSKKVMNEAIGLYIAELRKPAAVAFCLDYSGSMSGNGVTQLKDAMEFILDSEKASTERLQFSKNDNIIVIPFDTSNRSTWYSKGNDTSELITKISSARPTGGTNIYGCSVEALKELKKYNDDYTKSVILMTDGLSNTGSYTSLVNYYQILDEKIPIYSIMFGASDETELTNIANLTNAKVFDGRTSLIRAFKEVRSYN